MQHILFILFSLITVGCAPPQAPENKEPGVNTVEYESVVKDLDVPWAMAFLPDGSMLITEREGRLLRFDQKTGITEISGVPEVYARGQGGLLDISLHPKYPQTGWIYLTYSSPKGEQSGAHTALMRCKLKGDRLTDKEVLYKATPNTKAGQHYGSRIVFDREGYLYFSIGERGERDVNPQDLSRDGGKIYRLNDDGSIPSSNPFVEEPNAISAIYSYGHRNPQGLALHPQTGKVWEHEHGPRGGDEINIIKAGANYGWPEITYGINYSGTKITDATHKEGMEQPIHYWIPSIAPCGMAFVTSERYPDWKGDLLIGSLKFQYLERVVLDGKKVVNREKLLDDIGRVRAIEEGPDGYIYVAIEGEGIVRLLGK